MFWARGTCGASGAGDRLRRDVGSAPGLAHVYRTSKQSALPPPATNNIVIAIQFNTQTNNNGQSTNHIILNVLPKSIECNKMEWERKMTML